MASPWKCVAPGIYSHTDTGKFYERPVVNGRRTFRVLKGWNLKLAKEELRAKRTDQARASYGNATDPYTVTVSPTVANVLARWTKAGCPNARGSLPGERHKSGHEHRIRFLSAVAGNKRASEISPAWCNSYATARQKERQRTRAVDLEIGTLKCALDYAAAHGWIDKNPLAFGRPKFHRPSAVVHCREHMPANADELHTLANALFEDSRSEVLGFETLFLAYTGCRTSEALRCRWDAKSRYEAGFVEGDFLWLKRSKGGINPFVLLHPALRKLLDRMRAWHKKRFPKSVWFFPSPRNQGATPVDTGALAHALRRICPLAGFHHITPHGFRAYFVTVRRSQGISDAQIAAEIGDKTGATIIAQTYGDVPPNWKGAPGLTWEPASPAPVRRAKARNSAR
jgi:integrase